MPKFQHLLQIEIGKCTSKSEETVDELPIVFTFIFILVIIRPFIFSTYFDRNHKYSFANKSLFSCRSKVFWYYLLGTFRYFFVKSISTS